MGYINDKLEFARLENKIVNFHRRSDFSTVDLGLKNWSQLCEMYRHKYFMSFNLGSPVDRAVAQLSYIVTYAPLFSAHFNQLTFPRKEQLLGIVYTRSSLPLLRDFPDFEEVHNILGDYSVPRGSHFAL